MSIAPAPAGEMLATVKAREVQRGVLAEDRGDRAAAARHLLAAAHLELVLADDYASSGDSELAYRARASAASCFWRAGDTERARAEFDELIRDDPANADRTRAMRDELAAP